MKSAKILIIILTLAVLSVSGCGGGGGGGNHNGNQGGQEAVSYNPVIDPANFVDPAKTSINNPYLPLMPGTTYLYHISSADGTSQDDTVIVTHDTKTILGVKCTVVRDTAKSNGQLVEDTFDWYAQDKDGNVWYFGEDTKQYENGQVVGTEGAWEAGVNDAKPGIVMEGNPKVGDTYRQEYAQGVAEDMGEVLGLDESVTVSYGTFAHCVKTKDFSALEPDVVENKYFCPDIGQVLTVTVAGGSDRQELVSVTTGG